jgi:dTDP-glucose 4,6-dehydratase
MYGGGNQIRDWLYVYDHCRAIWMLEEQRVMNDRFNIGGECELRNIDVTKKILDILGKPHSLIGVSQDRPGQDKRYGMSFEKLTQRTGWIPHFDFDQALKMTVDWYLKK